MQGDIKDYPERGMRKMKKVLAIVMSAAMSLSLLAGCGASKAESTPSQPSGSAAESAPVKKEFKIALIVPGTVNDQDWSQLAYDAVKSVSDDLGATLNYSEKVASSDYDQILRGYASQGYNVVFAHGNEFSDAAKIVAADFPETQFIITSGAESVKPNFNGFQVGGIDSGFMTGAIAMMVSETGKVGAIGGVEMLPIIQFMKGFEAGAKYINPEGEVTTMFTGSLEDAAKAKEAAFAMIESGVDVLSQNANTASQGVIMACQEKGLLNVGAVSDQRVFAPDTVFISVNSDMMTAIGAIIRQAYNGQLNGEVKNLGIKEGAIMLTDYSEEASVRIPDETKAKIQELYDQIASGEVDPVALAGN